jgi:hypothetical protein
VTEIAAALEIGAAVCRTAEELKWRNWLSDLFKKKERIIVLGASGVGKSNLIKSLSSAGGLVDANSRINRTTATVKQRALINGKVYQFTDTPGQILHRPDRQSAVREAMSKPPVRVINVVSYGYHEYGADASKAIGPGSRPRPEFLEGCRQEELRALLEWLSILGYSSAVKWVVTAVTKADLWWKEGERVLNYYEGGDYCKAIKDADPKVHHSILPYCSVAHKFYNKAPLDGSFDDSDRIQIGMHFLSQLVDLG